MMTVAKIRKVLRWIHLILGLVVMCYIYSPFHENIFFQFIIKFVIIPVIAISGVWIWQFQRFNKLLRIKD